MSDKKIDVTGDAPESVTQDPESMPLDDLRDLIVSGPVEEEAPADEEVVEQEEATEEAETEDTPEDQPEAAEKDDEEETPAPTLEELQEALQAREAELEAEKAQRKHFESIAGRNAGEAGYLKKQYAELQSQIDQQQRQVDSDDDEGDRYEDRRPPPASAPRPQASGDIATSAIQLAAMNFTATNPEATVKGDDGNVTLHPDVQAELKNANLDVQSLMASTDVAYIAGQVNSTLDAAWQSVRAKRALQQSEEFQKRKADQLAALKNKREVSSASAGGGKAAVKKKPPDPNTMPLDQLRKLIEKKAAS